MFLCVSKEIWSLKNSICQRSHLMLVNWTSELDQRSSFFFSVYRLCTFLWFSQISDLYGQLPDGYPYLTGHGCIKHMLKANISSLVFFISICSTTIFQVTHQNQKSGSRDGTYMTWVCFIHYHSSPLPMSGISSNTAFFPSYCWHEHRLLKAA